MAEDRAVEIVKLKPGVSGEVLVETPAAKAAHAWANRKKEVEVPKVSKLSDQERKLKQKEYQKTYQARKRAERDMGLGGARLVPCGRQNRLIVRPPA